jgi:hypothetical protein
MTSIQLGQRMSEMYSKRRPEGDHLIGEVESATKGWLEASLLVKKSRPNGYVVNSLEEARARFSDVRGGPDTWECEP